MRRVGAFLARLRTAGIWQISRAYCPLSHSRPACIAHDRKAGVLPCREIWAANTGRSNRPGPITRSTVFRMHPTSRPVDQQPLMDAMNGIIAVNWKATEPHWTAASSPFDGKYSLILVYDGAGLVAFSVYRMLQISGGLAIYRSGTEVLPAHQGRGLYGFFTSEVLKSSGAAEESDGSVLYGWRTRNPIVWAANAKICEKVTPSLLGDAQDPALQAACIEMCSSLYPGKPPRSARHDHARRLRPHQAPSAGLSRHGVAGRCRDVPHDPGFGGCAVFGRLTRGFDGDAGATRRSRPTVSASATAPIWPGRRWPPPMRSRSCSACRRNRSA